ncbi:hypothetical protein [Frankia sp. Cj3]|uniref:hypothetical protein n=1 Tax=Frankia sp. Cj3 TaxID=2880976 RepID=UPI001EF66D39|nr:hypothetical protein [Frankia sp. Cj3]
MPDDMPEPEVIAALQARADAGDPGAAIILRRRHDRDMRRQIVLRAINTGALAGMSSEISEYAADLVIDALDRYDASRESDHWKSHSWECVPLSMLQQAVESRQRWQAKAEERNA